MIWIISSEASEHFVILANSSIVVEPCEGSFHNPPTGQYMKPLLLDTAHNHLQYKAKLLTDPAETSPSVSSINPYTTQLFA